MNCHLGGAIPCIGGAQKRAGGVASAKYSLELSRYAKRCGKKLVELTQEEVKKFSI